jgi:ABC-type nickel/cobalt efflux system permease component RcnA
MTRRWLFVLGAVLLGILVLPAQPASAHPLGNFTINQYEGLVLHPDRVDVTVVVDMAELPTRQERPIVGSDLVGYAGKACRELADSFEVRIGSDRLKWTVGGSSFRYAPGTGGLDTSILNCSLSAPARLTAPATVTVANHYRTDRVGWRELTATADGIRLVDSALPARSVSDELRAYPPDLLSSALDQTRATLRVEPGPGTSAAAPATSFTRGTDPLSRLTATAERKFQLLVGGHLTPLVGILAVLLAVLLGAGHAALPGHGKTVLAAYLAGRRGRPRDALVVGATVTLTHTGAVLLVGLLLSVSTALAGDRVLAWLGLASGLLIVTVGGWMLVTSRRRRDTHHHDDHSHHHDDTHHHHHGHPHGGKLSLAGIGLAGGLVPSPSALVVLLGAIGLGRAGFGVLLVLAYGLGMAGTLTGAGLLLLAVQRRVARAGWSARLAARLAPLGARLRATGTTATAALVVLVGLGLTVRALAGAV